MSEYANKKTRGVLLMMFLPCKVLESWLVGWLLLSFLWLSRPSFLPRFLKSIQLAPLCSKLTTLGELHLKFITFAVPAEIFPARLRSTCHGISTASGKAGATVGAFGFSYAVDDIGVRGILIILGVVNFLGLMFTFSVPEWKGKSLEELFGESEPENGSTAESRQAVPV